MKMRQSGPLEPRDQTLLRPDLPAQNRDDCCRGKTDPWRKSPRAQGDGRANPREPRTGRWTRTNHVGPVRKRKTHTSKLSTLKALADAFERPVEDLLAGPDSVEATNS